MPNIKGKFVAFCEGDDFWSNEKKLQMQYEVMSNFNLKASFHNTQIVDEEGNEIKEKMYPPVEKNNILTQMGGIFPGRYMLYFLTSGNCYLHISSFMLDAEEYIKYETDKPEFTVELNALGIGDCPLISYFAALEKTVYFPIAMSCYRNSHEGSFTYEMLKKMK